MRGGQLRHRISIQEQNDVADGMGGFTTTWSHVFWSRASIWPLSSKERLDTMKLESVVSRKIRIRYRSGITSKNRIVFGSKVFNILGDPVNYEERNKYLDMLCSEDS